jgi:hypothetical protein
MYYQSKTVSLLILGGISLLCSRTMLVSLNDPEGPNLLIVTVMAGIIYLVSLALYVSNSFASLTGQKRLLFTIFIQVLIATGFYFGLR